MFTLYPNDKIYEWSLNYSIRSIDLSLIGRYVNFSMQGIKECPVLQFEKVDNFASVNIPNILLQHHGVIQVYIYDKEYKYIEQTLKYYVYHRNKPDDYIYVETQDKITWVELDRRITELESGDIDISYLETYLQNHGYLTEYAESDPTVPEWAKQPTKPTYTAQEIGAIPDTVDIPNGIVLQPVDTTVAVDETANFSVVALNAESYQWYYCPSDSETFSMLTATGATSTTLSIIAKTSKNGQKYRCNIIFKDGTNVTSAIATMTVIEQSSSTTGGNSRDGGYYLPSVDDVGNLTWTPSDDSMPTVSDVNIKGQDGITPNIQIGTVSTLDSGENATASITGTRENPLLNLGIPRSSNGGAEGVSIATVAEIQEYLSITN